MGLNMVQKIVKAHLAEGRMTPGETIGIRIDQTLTQDATGTMAWLHFSAIGLSRVKTELSVSYVDHNTLQAGGPENAGDHLFLQSAAAKYGAFFSKAGGGICHQLHIERFAVPGKTLLGSDSHTPTAGGIGMLAIGAGGMDVALAMAGEPFYLRMPKVVRVELKGRLKPFVSAKDVILELLSRLSVKGGVGKAFEYGGPGVKTLTVPERATICNMGAELGATTSIFPADGETYRFLKAQGRERDFRPLSADPDADYDEVIELDLSGIEPLVARPHSPDNVVPVREIAGLKVHQVAIGSCTNSSYRDLITVARIFQETGARVHPEVSAAISPGSRQVLRLLADMGLYQVLVSAGFRFLECACGPCIGMGFSPPAGGISVRTFNRNFQGRSGTKDAEVYLVSPETAAATAIRGALTDPRELGLPPIEVSMPERFPIDDSMIIPPAVDPEEVELHFAPHIRYVGHKDPLPDELSGEVLLKVGDNITTDHILPGGAKILPLRSNIPAIAEYTFSVIDPAFAERAKEKGGGFIVGGENYGQGSSREHAAIAPMYLGIKAVIAKSFARIHHANLVNFGILPLTFVNPSDYERIDQGDVLRLSVRELSPGGILTLVNETKGEEIPVRAELDARGVELVRAGGILPYVKEKQGGKA
ncbi:aconitate hydratase [Candidatus Bipolaricaulota bacterium]|nr:aconitate hydratase [Candidatus Bipolaricaulota bacterium]